MDDQEVAVNISPGELLVWRGLKGISILLLAFMIRLGRETGEGELSTLLKIDRKTIRAHLQSLSAINFVARAGLRDGWTVTAAGRQLVLSLNLALEDGMAALGNGENFPSRKNGNGENLPIQGGGEGRISPLAQSLEESSLLTNQLKDSVLLDSEAGKLADILAAGRELLGEPLMTKCTDANLILGSIAQAWDKREKLRAQGSGFLARVATINIRKGQVEEKYCKAPLKFLPDGFVRRAGLGGRPPPHTARG